MKSIRLVKEFSPWSGNTYWRVEVRNLIWWDPVTLGTDELAARQLYDRLIEHGIAPRLTVVESR